jgi:hypothetical protein
MKVLQKWINRQKPKMRVLQKWIDRQKLKMKVLLKPSFVIYIEWR